MKFAWLVIYTMKAHEKEFLSKIEDLKTTFDTIKNNPSFIYNPDKPDGAQLINIRSGGEGMVEHTEILNAIIVPEWAFNAEFFDEKHEIAKIQFENYYADKNESLPQNMWQTPVKFVYDYCTYDYTIGSSSEKLDNYVEGFITYDEALEKFQVYQEKMIEMNTLIAQAKKKS